MYFAPFTASTFIEAHAAEGTLRALRRATAGAASWPMDITSCRYRPSHLYAISKSASRPFLPPRIIMAILNMPDVDAMRDGDARLPAIIHDIE